MHVPRLRCLYGAISTFAQHDIMAFNQRSQLQSCEPTDRHEHRSSNALSAKIVRVICGLLREPNRQAEECLGVALRGGE